MELELRNKEGLFIASFKGVLAESFFKFFLKEKRLTLSIKKFTGEKDSCRVFVNNSEEIIGGKNDFIEFFVRPGEYVKILDV